MPAIEDVIEHARRSLEEEDRRREDVLKVTREITRLAREAVGRIHRDDVEAAELALKNIRGMVEEILRCRESSPRLYYAGYVSSALTEYVEAALLLKYAEGQPLPTPSELNVEPDVYLLGLCDFVGELRRFTIRCLSRGRHEKAEETLALMESIYLALSKIILPDALVPGFRRKMDVMRIVLENTINDVMYYSTAHKITSGMTELLKRLGGDAGFQH